jgi:hypothetical protein
MKPDSHSAGVVISEHSEFDVRPLAILDVMLFMLITSVLLAFTTYVESLRPVFDYPPKTVNTVLQISSCCLNAALLTLLSILATRLLFRGRECCHPGHWLILGLGAIAVSSLFCESLYLFGSDSRGFPYLRTLDVTSTVIGSLVAIGLWITCIRRVSMQTLHQWYVCILIFIICELLYLFIELWAFFGFWNPVAASWSQGLFAFIPALIAVICARKDLTNKINRDWIHWAGVTASIACGLSGGIGFLLYYYYVIFFGATPA